MYILNIKDYENERYGSYYEDLKMGYKIKTIMSYGKWFFWYKNKWKKKKERERSLKEKIKIFINELCIPLCDGPNSNAAFVVIPITSSDLNYLLQCSCWKSKDMNFVHILRYHF